MEKNIFSLFPSISYPCHKQEFKYIRHLHNELRIAIAHHPTGRLKACGGPEQQRSMDWTTSTWQKVFELCSYHTGARIITHHNGLEAVHSRHCCCKQPPAASKTSHHAGISKPLSQHSLWHPATFIQRTAISLQSPASNYQVPALDIQWLCFKSKVSVFQIDTP